MAKERPEKDGELVVKREKAKRVSDDKIKKNRKKEEKYKKESEIKTELEYRPKQEEEEKKIKVEVEDEEETEVKVAPATAGSAQEDEARIFGRAPDAHSGSCLTQQKAAQPVAVQADELDPYAKKDGEKRSKRANKLREAVLDRLMEADIGPSPTASGKHLEVETARRRAKKAARKAEKNAQKELIQAGRDAETSAKTEAPPQESAEGEAKPIVDPSGLFMIDTKPTKVEWSQHTANNNNQPTKGKKHSQGSEQPMNRAARRRLQLIARQKEKIQKSLGVEVGSTEPNPRVDAQLAAWIEKTDTQAEMRETKKKAQKAKKLARLIGKRRRESLLTPNQPRGISDTRR